MNSNINPLINVFSLNVVRSPTIHNTALHVASTLTNTPDIILIQEPWWGCPNGIPISCNIHGWTPILPTTKPIKDNERPRVFAYARTHTNITVTPRTDIIDHLDIQILDISAPKSPHPLRLYNIYNQLIPGTREYSIDSLTALSLDPLIPTILTGDWNTHHLQFNKLGDGQSPSRRDSHTANWTNENGLHLINEWNETTLSSGDGSTHSALDFTFVNNLASQRNSLTSWQLSSELNCDSDHFATLFSLCIYDPLPIAPPLCAFNWKKLDEIKFVNHIKMSINWDGDHYEKVYGPIMNWKTSPPSSQQIDQAVDSLQDTITSAAEAYCPRKNPSHYGKPFWTEDLTMARIRIVNARNEAKCEKWATGMISTQASNLIKHERARFRRLYRKTKHNFFMEIAQNVTNNTFWPIVQWMSRTRNYQTPHLNQGEDLPPAVSHSDKCIALHKHLLPTPPPIENPPSIDLTEHPNDIEWHKVSSGEVHQALWKAASHNAPGPSGLCGLAYKIGWKATEAEITAIVQAAIEISYHPQQFHNSIVITICKPNKPDYTHPRAYRPIQLLEVLGKVIE